MGHMSFPYIHVNGITFKRVLMIKVHLSLCTPLNNMGGGSESVRPHILMWALVNVERPVS